MVTFNPSLLFILLKFKTRTTKTKMLTVKKINYIILTFLTVTYDDDIKAPRNRRRREYISHGRREVLGIYVYCQPGALFAS